MTPRSGPGNVFADTTQHDAAGNQGAVDSAGTRFTVDAIRYRGCYIAYQ